MRVPVRTIIIEDEIVTTKIVRKNIGNEKVVITILTDVGFVTKVFKILSSICDMLELLDTLSCKLIFFLKKL